MKPEGPISLQAGDHWVWQMLPKKQAALAPRWGGWAVGERRQPEETLGRLRRALRAED